MRVSPVRPYPGLAPRSLHSRRNRWSKQRVERIMGTLTYEKAITALLVIDPYNDFISEGGKLWDRLKRVAEANHCVPHMLQVLNAAREAGLRVFYALHHRYRPGDYETWKYIAPVQKAAWLHKTFEYGTWGGEVRREFEPKPGDVVALGHWGSSGFANACAGRSKKPAGPTARTFSTRPIKRARSIVSSSLSARCLRCSAMG